VGGECVVCEGDTTKACYNGHCCCAPNGCGPCDGPPVPNNPTGCEDTSFLAACNAHDNCYADCGINKYFCDTDFYNTMTGICNSSSCKISCLAYALAYYEVVFWGGDSAFQAAQNCSCGT